MVGEIDAVVTNPPYIPSDMIPRDPEARDHDPAIALFSGQDGLDVAREVVVVAADLLKPGGFFGMEHADVQGESVPALLSDMTDTWIDVKDNLDYNKLPRFTTAVRSAEAGVGR
jgi:release factor glutamine methyltransferase